MQTLKKNNFGHKRLKELTYEPYKTNSLRLSLLHLNSFKFKHGVGISIRIGPNFSSNIGIKVKNLYQFMDKCNRILYFWHRHFLFGCLLWSLQLKAIWPSMPSSTTKWQNHWGLWCFLLPNWLGVLCFDVLRSILILLEARTSSFCTLTLDIDGWTTEVDVQVQTWEDEQQKKNHSQQTLILSYHKQIFEYLAYHPV